MQTEADATDLVIEFLPGTFVETSRLRLVGISPDHWKMRLGSGIRIYAQIGEGSLDESIAAGSALPGIAQRQRQDSSTTVTPDILRRYDEAVRARDMFLKSLLGR